MKSCFRIIITLSLLAIIACGREPSAENRKRRESQRRDTTSTRGQSQVSVSAIADNTAPTLSNEYVSVPIVAYTKNGKDFRNFFTTISISKDSVIFKGTKFYYSSEDKSIFTPEAFIDPEVTKYSFSIGEGYVKVKDTYYVTNLLVELPKAYAHVQREQKKSYTVKAGDTHFSIRRDLGISIKYLTTKYPKLNVGQTIYY